MRRSSIFCASAAVPPETKLLIGSTITVVGAKSVTALWICTRCASRPSSVGRDAWICNRPFRL